MATKREMKAEIETLSSQLGVSVETDGLNHDALTKLVEGLKLKAAAAADSTAAGEILAEPEATPVEPGLTLFGATKRAPVAPPPPPVVEPPVDVAPAPPIVAAPPAPPPAAPASAALPAAPARFYRVAQGCVIYTLRGKVGAFRPIKAIDLGGGQEALDELVRAGQVEAKR